MTFLRRFLCPIVLFFVVFETAARCFSYLTPNAVRAPYSYDIRRGVIPDAPTIHWRTNRFGARATPNPGGKQTIAIFGGSNALDTLLSHEQSWGYKLGELLGAHVENYSIDGGCSLEATEIVDFLASRGRRFDLVISMLRPPNQGERRPAAFSYGRGRRPNSRESFLLFALKQNLFPWLQKWENSATAGDTALWKSQYAPRASSNREIRNKGLVKFSDVPESLEAREARKRHGIASSRGFFEAVKKISRRVVNLNPPIAFDEAQIPGVAKRWFLLDPLPDKENTYISNRTHADIRRLDYAAIQTAAAQSGIPTFDLDGKIRPLLRTREDLFLDHAHLSPIGTTVAADLIAKYLREMLLEPRGRLYTKVKGG